jgi:hypothetical protein
MNQATPPAPPSLIRFQSELEDAIRRDLARTRPRPRRAALGVRLGAVVLAAAVIAAIALVTSTAGPDVQTAEATTIARAADALQPASGAILHIDSTLTTTYPQGQRWSTRQDVWQQQQGALCNWLNLRRSAPGTPAGTESGTVNGRDELYDPVRNTIYIAPPIRVPPPPQGVTLPNECSYMADFAKQVRGLLTSGRARVDGRATIDGRDTIKIVFTRAAETYYVAADGTYAPVELISGRPTDKNGTTTTVFQAYEELPGSSHGYLLSLTARHPSAAVVYSLAGYRAANNRLFPDG